MFPSHSLTRAARVSKTIAGNNLPVCPSNGPFSLPFWIREEKGAPFGYHIPLASRLAQDPKQFSFSKCVVYIVLYRERENKKRERLWSFSRVWNPIVEVFSLALLANPQVAFMPGERPDLPRSYQSSCVWPTLIPCGHLSTQ